MANNLPAVQKTNWVDNEIVRPTHTNGWGEAINILAEDLPLYASVGNYYTATFSNNIYTLTPLSISENVNNATVSEYYDGMTIVFKCPITNPGSVSVNVNSLGVKAIKSTANTDLTANLLIAGSFIRLIYDKINGYFKFEQDTSKANISLNNLSQEGTNLINTAINTAISQGINTLLGNLYPVGSIYIGTQSTCPLANLGIGTWVLVSGDRVLQGSTAVEQATGTVNASLPTLTAISDGNHQHNRGTMDITGSFRGADGPTHCDGAFYRGSTSVSGAGAGTDDRDVMFKASRKWSGLTNETGAHTHSVQWTNHVGTTVQPNAYIVNIWRRTA